MIYILGDVYNVFPNLDLPINDRVWSLKCPPSQKSSYNATYIAYSLYSFVSYREFKILQSIQISINQSSPYI